MLKGKISISIMIGPGIPIPVPKAVIDALSEIEVTSEAGIAGGFSMVFNFSSRSPLNTLLLLIGEAGPIIRTIIVVNVNGTPNVLMDGMIEHHQLTPNVQTGESTFTIMGSDLTSVMNYVDFSGLPFPCMPIEARIEFILAKYAILGVIPLVIPRIFYDIPIITENIPAQKGNDLQYITQLASIRFNRHWD
jgi:hypothetical protein